MTKGQVVSLVVAVGLFVGLVSPVVMVQAQITPGPEGPVDYPGTITKNIDKLYACYSLISDAVDEYNRQSDIASANVGKYEGKFRAYVEDYFEPMLAELLAERNRLMDAIISGAYSPEDWAKLSDDEAQQAAYLDLFGNKTAEAEKPTLAVCPTLESVKLVDLDLVVGKDGFDPVEDLTTYTEVDPDAYISLTGTNRANANSFDLDIDAYLYDDKGVDHFDGDFEHLLIDVVTSATASTPCAFWIVANDVDDFYSLRTPGVSHLGHYYTDYGTRRWCLFEQDSTTTYTDIYEGVSLSTVYYQTVKRNEAVGTYGTLYLYICTGNYYGESGSSLVDTLSIALHTSKKDYRYVYVLSSYNAGTSGKDLDGYMQDLDLQEAAPGVTPYAYGYIIGGGP